MSLLSEEFRKIVMKDKDLRMSVEAKCDIGYSSGYLAFDFLNGYMIHVNNNEKNIHQKYYCIGFMDGSFNSIIGKTGCGKSTFALQTAANIVRPFQTSCIFEDSIEGGMNWTRREVLSGFNEDELKQRFIVRNTGVNAENFYKRIKMIHDIKIRDKDKYMYDTGNLDNFGNPLWAFEPTVYILDSVAMLYPENMAEEDELQGSMAVSGSVKVVSQMVSAIIPMLKAANIIVFAINHIKDDIQTGPFVKKPDVQYLKVGERLPKGKAVTYLSNNIIRLDTGVKLKPEEKFHISGSIVDVSTVKSRSSAANKSVSLVFNQYTGFDPILSMFIYLQNNGRVNGAGVGLYLDEYKDYKFSMGNLLQKMENPEFAEIFNKVAFDQLSKSMVDPYENSKKEFTRQSTNNILNMMKPINY